MGHSGFAIVMTSLTTAAGMWSFSFSDVAPVADLGIFASASIVTTVKGALNKAINETALTIVKTTVTSGRTTPETRLNIKAKIKITMSSIF
jgi:predicted RND superfamily exporter protein